MGPISFLEKQQLGNPSKKAVKIVALLAAIIITLAICLNKN